MFKSLVLTALVAVIATAQSPAPDACGGFLTCTDCISHQLCGWCSEPVIFPGNITGPQCAGFSPNGSQPFACNGIYSTDTCISGYLCNLYNFTCDLAPPGQGVPKQMCESSCYNKGQVYTCNSTSKKCQQVPPGTPNATNYQVCMDACNNVHPTNSPTSPPAPTSTNTPTTASPTSTPTAKYVCNQFLWQCVSSPVGNDLKTCEAQCGNPSPNPGPPPAFLGTWRGVFIQSNYETTEMAMEIKTDSFRAYNSATNTSYQGIPLNYQSNGQFQLWVNFTQPSNLAGKVVKAFGSPTVDSPETRGMTIAWGGPGGPIPASVDEAMAGNNGESVTFMSKCITPVCVFTLPSSIEESGHKMKAQEVVKPLTAREVDHCSTFNANCSQCLSQQYCGWCSENVTYNDGTQGTQCAGFNPNGGGQNPFVCQGRYSTLDCTPGYKCDTNSYQCVETDPGNGFPHDICLQVCHPTPAPSQTPQFVCNATTQTCSKCDKQMCPGSMPESECDAACTHAKPGPQASTIGFWRGVQIRNAYTYGEFELSLSNVSATMYYQKKLLWNATVQAFGSNMMTFNFTEGQNIGRSQSALFQLSTNAGLVDIMDIAFGPLDGQVPGGFDEAMSKPDDQYVLVSCLQGTPCKFSGPPF